MKKNIFGAFMCMLMIAIVPASVGTMLNQNQIEKTTQLNAIQNSQIPDEIIQYENDWPLANKDYSNTRATSNSGIDSTNVANLTLTWSYPIQGIGGAGGAASNPLILGDIVYFQDLQGNVAALDFQTGDVLWSKMYNSQGIVGPNGPGVGYGKIYVAKDLYNVTALDIKTGAEIWTTRISNIATTGIDIQPVVYDGKVYVSTVPGTGDVFYAPGGIGVVYALDQETGQILWNFSTVDSNLWGHPEVNSGGGCWYPPAIDLETNNIYWTVANPAPFAGAPGWPSGTSYAGPALYTNSLVVLNHNTGQMKWFTQALAHDIFDHDLQISPILIKANISGIEQDIVICSGKMGNVYAINRDNGAIRWVVPVGKHANDTLDVLTGETEVYPGILGGVETNMAYSNGILYVPVVDLATSYIPTGINYSSIDFSKGKGQLVAIDVNLGKILWYKVYNSLNFGAATVVNDVVFTATYDGMIYAYNAITGDQLFTYQAPAGINAWPAVAGNTIIWPAGVSDTPLLIALRVFGANEPPETPTIDGPTNGRVGISYNYTFVTTDPNGDNVFYLILWGDECPSEVWQGPYPSGQVITFSYTYDSIGSYIISCRAKDIFGLESDVGTLQVTMPKNLPSNIQINSQSNQLLSKLIPRRLIAN